MTKSKNYTDISDKTKQENGSKELEPEGRLRLCSSRKKTASSDYVSIIEHLTKSPRRIDTPYLLSAKHSTDWQEPNTLPSWTSKTHITTYESGKETNIRRHSQRSWEHTNIESCHLDYATHQQHSNDGSTRPSWNTSICVASSI